MLARAIAATFERRATQIPDGLPLGLTVEFAANPDKQRQWQAFLQKNRIEAPELVVVVAEVGAFLQEPIRIARASASDP